MTFYLLSSLLLLFSLPAYTAVLSGQVEILKKGGDKPEDSFEHAVVYLSGISTPPPDGAAIQVQKNKQFSPRLLTVVKGQQVDFHNKDKVKHNVFSTDKLNPFELGRYGAGEFRSVTFNNPGIQPVYCNIHQKMVSYVAVVDSIYSANTTADGHYQIENIPPR